MKNLIMFITGIIILSSCQTDYTGLMPNVTGKAGEMVFVLEDALWESAPGDSIKSIFQADCPGIMPTEPLFDMVRIPGKAFDRMFQTHRNIVWVKVSKDIKKNKVLIKKDVWAQPQTVVQIDAKDKKSLMDMLETNRYELVDVFIEAERKRAITNNLKYEEHAITQKLKNKHKLSLYCPKGYVVSMDSTNFVWISQTLREAELGILTYYYEYTDTSNFNPVALINTRDSILRTKVHGGIEGSFMSTDRNFPIDYKEINYNDQYAVEIRGWWETTGKQFWGGPFVSLTTVDESRNRLVTVEGFVFSPGKDKRTLLRRLESILYSLKFVKNEKEQ